MVEPRSAQTIARFETSCAAPLGRRIFLIRNDLVTHTAGRRQSVYPVWKSSIPLLFDYQALESHRNFPEEVPVNVHGLL